MKTLLIVEDEKAIRAGIRAMVSRAPVAVENILECRNGEEAMEILRSQPVDVMITDIRMPKMDGVELIRQARGLPSPPITVVVSGYGDFNYAVSVFRDKVWDYILKPIEREHIFTLLKDIQNELDAKSLEKSDRLMMNRRAFRSLMLGSETNPEELRALSSQYSGKLFDGCYVSVCLAPAAKPETEADIPGIESGLCFTDMEGHTVLLIPEASLAVFMQKYIGSRCAGLSTPKSGAGQLRESYLEAVQARKRAFVRGSAHSYESLPAGYPKNSDTGATPEQIVQLLGTGNAVDAIRLLERVLFLAQNEIKSPDDHLAFLDRLQSDIISAYPYTPDAPEEYRKLKDILSFENAYEHHTALKAWFERLSGYLTEKQENSNKHKIRASVEYIGQRFRSDINMATASNHISMNYTQFSTLFKKYTGSSFPDYLLNVRLAESRRLLADPSLSIRSVSRLSGFRNEKHFMRCFKQTTGVSPGVYRRNLQTRNTG